MSASLIASLKFASQQVTIYGGLTVLVFGLLGGTFNLLVFFTLRTFRHSSSAVYLIIMTICNIGQLLIGLLARTLVYINQYDFADISLPYCKVRLYFSHVCVMISLTCFCLATIDQFCGTSSYQKLRQTCRIKIAAILVSFFSLFWILHGIPYIILSYHSQSSNTSAKKCVMTNIIYVQYRTYIYLLILNGCLPLSIIITFGIMSWCNIRNMLYYTVPLVRREFDKQITRMILSQVIVSIFTILPYTITNIVSKNLQNSSNSLVEAQMELSSNATLLVYYIYYAVSDY